MVKRKKFCGRQKKKETTYNKKIKTEFCPSSFANTVIKEEVNVDEENSFRVGELSSSVYTNHIINAEITFNEDVDCFPGFSTEEYKSSKVKAGVMQRLVCDERREEISNEECIEDGSNNVTCVQKTVVRRKKSGGRQKKKETTYNKKIKTEFCPSSAANSVIKEEINIDEENSFPAEEPNLLPENAVIKVEGVSEESAVRSVLKEEPIIENTDCEDVSEVGTFSGTDTHINEDIIQATSNRSKCGLSEARSVSTQKYKCVVCNKAFCHLSSLSTHKLIHRGVKRHQCDICKKAFTHKGTLLTHKLIHSGVKKHQCDICNKAFVHKRYLPQHKLLHSGVMRYQCDVCNKAFPVKNYLAKHKLMHSGVKKHQCGVCKKAFALSSNYLKHMLIHSGVKKHRCDVCNKAFTQTNTLATHKLIHSNIKEHLCDVCSKAFTHKLSLEKHKLIHSGVKKHECNVCNKAFILKSYLLIHKKIHSGGKKYQCDVCKKAFTAKCNVARHINTLHCVSDIHS